MLFNSYGFILLLLPIALVGYFTLNAMQKYRAGLFWLAAISVVFYGLFNWVYVPLLLISIAVNYLICLLLAGGKAGGGRKLLFVAGLLFHIGLLFYFKYYNFFADTVNEAFGAGLRLHELVLPVGISFFTFQQIAYLADCFQGQKPYGLLEYTAYVTFFPKLVQGPLASHQELIGQFLDRSRKKWDFGNVNRGIYAFTMGLAKKVLLADVLAGVVNRGFEKYYHLDGGSALLVMICYTLQLYFDFSGYCDMAAGVAKMMNLELPFNFNSPYKADSISDFWDRWHMTLTRFFTRYIYIPLGGSRKGRTRTCINIMIVFLISGIWHGANWTFILWGAVHGAGSVLTKLCGGLWKRVPRFIRVFFTFTLVNFAWCLFRADTIALAFDMIKRVFTMGYGTVESRILEPFYDGVEISILCELGLQKYVDQMPSLLLLLFVGACLFGVFFMKNTREKMEKFVPGIWKSTVCVLLLTWSILSLGNISEFIYFNF